MSKRTLAKLGAGLLITLVAVFGIAWLVVVPDALKHIVAFQMWRGDHVRASGYVDREPGTRIYFEEYGEAQGKPVVVLHGAFGSITVMGAQIRPLHAQGRRVLAIDSRAQGRSTNSASALTYEMMTDDVVAVMDARELTAPVDVVGWSDGGNSALDLARRYPGRVRKVVAYGAVHDNKGVDAKTIEEMRAAKPDDAMLAPMRAGYERESPTPEKWPETVKLMQTMLVTEPRWTLEQLAAISAPVLLVNGEHDIVLRSHAEAIKSAIPGARLEIVAGATHGAPLENADTVNKLTLEFL